MAIMIKLPAAERRLQRFGLRGQPRTTKKALAEAIINRAVSMNGDELYNWLNGQSVTTCPDSSPSLPESPESTDDAA